MADFMMCRNSRCPSRSVCYRNTATASPNQRYYEYDHAGRAACAQFWPAQDSDKGVYVPEPRKFHATGGQNTGIIKRIAKKAEEQRKVTVEKRKLGKKKKAAG